MSDKRKVYDTKKGTKIQFKARKRSKISNRKPVNLFSVEKDDANISTSAKKLQLSKDEYDVEFDSAFGYRLLNFIAVFSAISELVQNLWDKCKIHRSKQAWTRIQNSHQL